MISQFTIDTAYTVTLTLSKPELQRLMRILDVGASTITSGYGILDTEAHVASKEAVSLAEQLRYKVNR